MARRREPDKLREDAQEVRTRAATEADPERRHLELIAEIMESNADTLEALDLLHDAFTQRSARPAPRRA